MASKRSNPGLPIHGRFPLGYSGYRQLLESPKTLLLETTTGAGAPPAGRSRKRSHFVFDENGSRGEIKTAFGSGIQAVKSAA
jgi:hypothetical protein